MAKRIFTRGVGRVVGHLHVRDERERASQTQPSSRAHSSTSQEMRRASRGLRACGRRPEHVPGFTGNQEIPSEHARVGRIQAQAYSTFQQPNSIIQIAKCRDSPPRQHRRAFTELRNLIQIEARGSLSHNVGVVQLHAQHNPNPVACLILYAVLERIVKDLKLPG